ncbi:hypothetical protein BJY52DRAFT_1314046 [Lactarius psammicola]|nr:hypothetical protein BJY52DRAFT_1314046 [Lactarius psammicola]
MAASSCFWAPPIQIFSPLCFSCTRVFLRETRSYILSQKILNVGPTLFGEDQIGAQDGYVPSPSIKWEGVRRKSTRFLQAVHTREGAL